MTNKKSYFVSSHEQLNTLLRDLESKKIKYTVKVTYDVDVPISERELRQLDIAWRIDYYVEQERDT